MLGQGGRVPSSPGQGGSSCGHSPSEMGESLVLVEPSAAVSDTEGAWAQEGPMWALLSPQSFQSSDPSLRPPQSVEGRPAPCLPVAALFPPPQGSAIFPQSLSPSRALPRAQNHPRCPHQPQTPIPLRQRPKVSRAKRVSTIRDFMVPSCAGLSAALAPWVSL